MLKYQIPTWLQKCYSNVTWRKDINEKILYLTFDDGCIPEVTPSVLKILEEKGVKATFFCVGNNVCKHPSLFEEIKQQGHQVGNHTQNHLKGAETSLQMYLDNIEQAHKHIKSQFFRPPYGRMTRAQKLAVSKNYKIVLWDVLTNDFDAKVSVEELIRQTLRHTRNGSIVVFHDSLKAAPRMLPALPVLIDQWKAQGYRFDVL